MAIEISAEDVARAETFIETLLTESIPEGRFTKGSALHDLVVNAFAFIFAHLQKENTELRSLQSLLTVQDIATEDPDLDTTVANATDAILSNWFITRNSGGFARGSVSINVSRRQDYVIPANNRFGYDRTRVFFPDVADTSQNLIVSADDLLPVIGVDGTIEGYQFNVNVVAARTGVTYNVDPTTWESGESFSPFVTSIFSTARFAGGANRESTSSLIDRSGTAVSVRNLINERSIDATLRDNFSSLIRLITIGHGDPEMQRDLRLGDLTTLKIHVGGAVDIYAELPRVQTTFEGLIGGSFVRPDGVINIFKDSTIADWTAESIQLGDVLRIGSGIDEAPQDYVIKEILSTELRVSDLNPFSVATDEAGTFVDYFIFRPQYGADVQLIPAVGSNTTGQTSRTIQTPNRAVLPGGAHYDILDVAVIDPDPADPNITASDGRVHFPVRTNETPNLVISSEFLEYQIISNNPDSAQSMRTFEEIELESTYNNRTVQITYETLSGLSSIDAFVQNRFERVLACDTLARGFNPVYLSINIPYRTKPTATALVNETTVRQAVTDFINDFDPNDVIDTSDISLTARNADSNIGAVLPFNITYTLISPDGRTIQYVTSDEVKLESSYISTTLANSALDDPLSLGISDRTVRYMTTFERITVTEQT